MSDLNPQDTERPRYSTLLAVGGVILTLAGVALLSAASAVGIPEWTILMRTLGALFIGAAVLLAYVSVSRSIRREQEVSSLLADSYRAAQDRVEREPDKTKPAWDLARVTLEQYFNRNLSQNRSIFRLSVFVMLVGFGFILYAIWLGFQTPEAVTPAIIAGTAGILTEFIGATFLFLYRSTVEQAAKYTTALERMNTVGMAMQILDTVTNDEDEESIQKVLDAKIAVAKLLLTPGWNPESPST